MSDFNIFQKGMPLPQSSYSLLMLIYSHMVIENAIHP